MGTQSLNPGKAANKAASALNRGAGFAALCAVSLLAIPLPVHPGGPGSSGMQVLKSDMSPRAAGMGGAFVSVADDIYTMDYNPAGLGQLYIPEASAMYLSGFDDARLNHIAFGMPLPFIGLAGLAKPGAGISLMLSDAGKFDYRQRIPSQDPAERGTFMMTSESLEAQKDLVLAFGYGEKVYSDEVNLQGYNAKIEQYLGMNVKYVNSKMLEKYSASALAFDGGWLLMEPKLGLSLGASLANYGGGLTYVSETTSLPSILRIGASYQRPTVMDQSVLLAAEGDFYTSEAMRSLRFGLEYHFEKVFNLRLGYKAAEDNNGITMGLGLHYGDMSLDLSSGISNEVYNSTLFALSYKFSGITIKEYRKKVNYRGIEPRKAAPARVRKPARQETRPVKAAPEKKKTGPEKKDDSDFFTIY